VFLENSPDQTDTASQGKGTASIGTSTASLLAANAARIEFTICNGHATQKLYLSLGTAAAEVDKGVIVQPLGSYTTKSYTGAVQAIASGATTNVAYVEI
jgi:hypothetical protein